MQRALYNPDLGELNDFKNFLYLVWHWLPDIAKDPTELQYDIADYLQNADNPWTIVMAYRGTGKSYVTAAFVVWLWLVNPEFKILVISASEDKAKDFAILVKQIIEGMELCQHLRPRKGQRDSALSFDVGPATPAKDPSLNVYGITGQITGGRADFIIPDDVETPDNSATVTQREKLSKKLNEIVAIIKGTTDVRKPQIKMLGTPQTEQSIYFEQEKQGFSIRVWPALYPTDITKYRGRLAPWLVQNLAVDPTLAGTPTNPLMHDAADLAKRAIRKAFFQLQYMLDPSLSDAEKYPLKLRDLLVHHVDPDQGPVHMTWADDPRMTINDTSYHMPGLSGDHWIRPWTVSDKTEPWEQKLMVVDPAGGNDKTAYAVLYFLRGFIHLAEWSYFTAVGQKTLEGLADVAAKHQVHLVKVERNYGAIVGDSGEKTSAFTELLKPYLARKVKCAVETVHVTGRKEPRICDALEPVLGAHRLVVSDDVIKADGKVPEEHLQGFWQMSHMTRALGALVKDDMIDVLSLGVAHFVDQMALDTETTERQLQEELTEKTLQSFMRMASRGRTGLDEGGWLDLSKDALTQDHEADAMAFAEDRPWWDTD